ncbi:hypothetical protein [Chromobacterium alticapitis]|uniref:Uncharacterized protein n=1 Tax=Chromobacterium alticapitis TaxID=2073169 RepID=A0A2S5DA61_9NEIS|nr:hypothetical protein [Chromobacterium alticapitis]POZ59975.1 hypothetical protein C2I19_21340 [Chromobacterium alticapitis]
MPDIASLDVLARQLTEVYKTEDGQTDRMSALLSEDFNYSGMNASQYLNHVVSPHSNLFAGTRISRIHLLSCENANRCEVSIAGDDGKHLADYVVIKVDKDWLIAGNDYPVNMFVGSSAQAHHQIDRQSQKDAVSYAADFTLSISKQARTSSGITVRSAQLR